MKVLATALFTAAVLVVGADRALASPISLWVGFDPFGGGAAGLLNTTRAGAVLTSINPLGTGANGIAVDVLGNRLYVSDRGVMQTLNLTTLANIGGPVAQSAPTGLPEDMTFDGTNIWRTDYSLGRVNRIDPLTNVVLGFFAPIGIAGPVGIAWDGTGLWVGAFDGTRIEKFTTAGVDTGLGFNVTDARRGGLAFDSTDGTLFLGTDVAVRHYTTAGALLGSFSVLDSRFVDGLEFEGPGAQSTVPEPASLVLFGTGLYAVVGRALRKRRRVE